MSTLDENVSTMVASSPSDGRSAPTPSQGAGNEQLRSKQPLDVRTATKGLFALSAVGNAAALRALFDECVLIDHTAQVGSNPITLSPGATRTPQPRPHAHPNRAALQGLDDCQPVPGDLVRDEDGATALLPACEGGHVECVQLLLKHGCPPGKPNRVGRTPVMTCCFGGQADYHGPDPKPRPSPNASPSASPSANANASPQPRPARRAASRCC